MTGPPYARARASALSTACSSWPSTGPRYFRPRSSNIPWGATMSFSPFFIPCRVPYIAPPTTGVPLRADLPQSRKRS